MQIIRNLCNLKTVCVFGELTKEKDEDEKISFLSFFFFLLRKQNKISSIILSKFYKFYK